MQTPPAAPTNLVARPTSTTRVELSWLDTSTNETGFRVERGLEGSGSFVQIGSATASTTAHVDTSVAAGVAYAYRVVATNAVGDSPPSNVAGNFPAAPTSLTATTAPGGVRLEWSDRATNEASVLIERSATAWGQFAPALVVAADVTSFLDVRAAPGATYRYRIRASNAAGVSALTSVASTVVTWSPPDVVFPDPGAALPVVLSGAIEVPYVAVQPQGQRVDVIVEVDPGTGTFQRATQAPSLPGGRIEGVEGVAALATGSPHVFLWNSVADLPNRTVSGVSLRIATRIPTGVQSAWRVVSGLTVANGPSFGPGRDTAVPGATAIAAGDVDGDGFDDVACVDSATDTVTLLLADGSGGFRWLNTLATGSQPRGVAVADVDDDGKLDVVVANAGSDDLTVLFGVGDGSIAAVTTVAVGDRPCGVAVADLDRDGRPDVVAANEGSGDVSICLGAGGRAFGAATAHGAGTTPTALVIADLDRDGRLDLAVADAGAGAVSVLLGLGGGSFSAAVSYPAGDAPATLVVIDWNADGRLDLAVACAGDDSVAILTGAAGGVFSVPGSIPVGVAPTSLATGALDADGRPDLVVVGGNELQLLLGDGTGGVRQTLALAAPTARTVATADLDRDGRLDLVAGRPLPGTLTTFPSTRPRLVGAGFETPVFGVDDPLFFASGDVNLDGRPDLAVVGVDLMITIALGQGDGTFETRSIPIPFVPSAVTIGDFDQDGAPDLAVATPPPFSDLELRRGDGRGNFGAPTSFQLFEATELYVKDMNGDGLDDLVACTGENGRIRVFAGLGGMSFSGTITSFTGYVPVRLDSMAIADLNGDTIPDAATVDFDVNRVIAFVGDGTGRLTPTAELGVGARPTSVSIGDIDGDGRPDLAVANSEGASVSLLRATGGGAFSAPTTVPGFRDPMAVRLLDLDRDADLDLVVGDRVLTATRNDGAGNFDTFPPIPLYAGADRLVPGDFDADGRVDVASIYGYAVRVASGRGDSTFRTEQDLVRDSPVDGVRLADLNIDGQLDLVLSRQFRNVISVFFGVGDGTFGPPTNYPVGSSPWQLSLADLDADGDLDVAVACRLSDSLDVLLNGGSGTFGAPTSYAVGDNPYSVAESDLDQDGDLDLVVANWSSSTLSVLLGTGTGTFVASSPIPVSPQPSRAIVADLNRDGRPDLVVGGGNGSGTGATNVVDVKLGLGGASFGPTRTFPFAGFEDGLAVGDVSDDGIPDVVAGATILLGVGDGTLAAGGSLPLGHAIAIADLDGDGLPDVVVRPTHGPSEAVAVVSGAGASVLLWGAGSNATAVAVGDLNHDGRLDLVFGGSVLLGRP